MFYFTILIVLLMFAFDMTLSILNYRQRKEPIPNLVSDVYDASDYTKWLEYTMELFKLTMIQKILSTTVFLGFLVFHIFPKLSQLSSSLTSNNLLEPLVFLGLYLLINYLLDIGFNLYRTFSIEERYGFNKTTVKTYIFDQLKSIFLTILLGGSLLYLLIHLFDQFSILSLVYAWFIIIAIMLISNILYSKLFIRIFNKLTPLPEGELKNKTVEVAEKMGYEIKKISVMDASKRSSRINAFFSGFGKFKSIVLYDTLIEKCTTDEIISVLTHEIGHSKHKDVLRNIIFSMIELAFYLIIFSFFLSSESFAITFGFSGLHIGFAMILFLKLLEPIGLLLNIPLSYASRKAEYRADATAKEIGYGPALISALKILARENFANLTPHPLVVTFTYSHPTINQRIKALTS